MTFSIVARDPATGDLGVAVASKFLAVGAVVPWAMAGVGAIATQALANVTYGPDGLDGLRSGAAATAILERLVEADAGRRRAPARDRRRARRRCDPHGIRLSRLGRRLAGGRGRRARQHPGRSGHVVAAVLDALHIAVGPFPDRLVASLLAGDRAGGDARGRQSAALLVVREAGGYGGSNDRWIDLRVDDHPDPVPELGGSSRRGGSCPSGPTRRTSCRSTRRWPSSCAID